MIERTDDLPEIKPLPCGVCGVQHMVQGMPVCPGPRNEHKQHLGDGAYVYYQPTGIWLTAEDGLRVTNRVWLEWSAVIALRYFLSQRLIPD